MQNYERFESSYGWNFGGNKNDMQLQLHLSFLYINVYYICVYL